jgi:hypothetical protein
MGLEKQSIDGCTANPGNTQKFQERMLVLAIHTYAFENIVLESALV